ncbi:MAG TPA: tetratricopeptide repeat protein [Nitrospirota bacterium]|jgi:tetratricopeptide (TPR) repeat protein
MTRIVKQFAFVVLLIAALTLSACSKEQAPQSAAGPADLAPPYPQQAQMLEEALAKTPNSPDILIKLGNLYYDWGQDEANSKGERAQPQARWSRAVDYYGRALALDPKNNNVRVDMANLERYLGDPDKAISLYRDALKIEPNHPQARLNLLLALGQDKKDYKAAVKEYDNLLAAAPETKNNLELKAEVDGFREAAKEVKK